MSTFSEKLRKGQLGTEAEWEAHLIEAHQHEPRMTPEAFAGYKTSEGKNSYAVLAEIMPHGDWQVLDLACGDGHLISHLLPRLGPNGQVLGADMSEEGIQLARPLAKDPRVKFAVARAQQLPVADAAFDYILCHMALMLMAPLPPVMKELRRVLKTNGTLSAIVGGGTATGFYKEMRKITGLFVQAHLPRFHESRQGSGALTEQLSASFGDVDIYDFYLNYRVTPDGVWEYMRNMYFVPILPEHAQREFKDELINAAVAQMDDEGKVQFQMPMRRLTCGATG
jgi:SAM-dependent methyltransferase